MSFKTILVHVDDVETCKARLDAAVQLALDCQAQLVGLYLVPAIDQSSVAAMMLPTDLVERRVREIADAQRAAEDVFRRTAADAGLAAVDWRAPAGSPIAAAVAQGRCTDLFIVGQRNPPGYMFAEELVTTVMLETGRPILVVPYIGARPTIGQNVLVAWDGGREATRAVADAMPMLERARRVTVIAVGREADERIGASLAETPLAGWLRQHGVKVDFVRDDVSDVTTGEWLLSRAADLGSDLMVMGGYAHTRMRELILGGVTRTMLQSMTVPVLMAH
jgi:nucleotide-binding universal stress UspA family protein